MSSKFSSPFRRRVDAAAPASAAAEGTSPAAEKADAAKTSGATETASKADDAEAGKVTVAARDAGETGSAETEAHNPAPARLVERETPKPAATDPLTQAKMWLSNAHAYRVPAAAATALVLALGAGYGFGANGQLREAAALGKTAKLLETTAKDLRDAHGQIVQLSGELKSVKTAVEAMKTDREKSRGDLVAKQAQVLDRVERAGQENATRVGRLAEQLDRIEKAQRITAAADKQERAADKGEKADKPEKVAATAPLPPAKPVLDVAHTGSIGETKPVEKPDPRKTPLEGYIVRDYDDGFALIETRAGRYIDVAVGYNLPGVGRIEAIERRGRQWVVITPKGYIGER